MATNEQDILARAYAMLSALRKNIEQVPSPVPEKYVLEYDKVLNRLEGIGINVTEFRVPDSQVIRKLLSINILTGKKKYSEQNYVERPFVLTKLDAILGYFEITTSDKPIRIDFSRQKQ